MNGNYTKNRTMTNAGLMPYDNVGYITNTVRARKNEQVLTFPNQTSARARAIKKVNTTLGCLLLGAIIVSAISYFFVVSSEIKLNKCSRETTVLNIENSELENKLDKLKSFNNVDLTIQKSNLLKRPEKVIEATEVKVSPSEKNIFKNKPKAKAWAIGY